MTWWMTLRQVGAHLGVKASTLQHQIIEERGLGYRLHAQKPGRDWLVDARESNREAEQRGRPLHYEPACAERHAERWAGRTIRFAAADDPLWEPGQRLTFTVVLVESTNATEHGGWETTYRLELEPSAEDESPPYSVTDALVRRLSDDPDIRDRVAGIYSGDPRSRPAPDA